MMDAHAIAETGLGAAGPLAHAEETDQQLGARSALPWLTRVSVLVNRGVVAITVALLLALVVVIGAEVVFRYILNNSLIWADAVARMLFIWIVFLGASIGLRRRALPAIQAVINATPARVRPWLPLMADVIMGSFLILLLIHGVSSAISLSDQFDPSTNWPVSYLHAVIPLAAALMLLHLVAMRAEDGWHPIRSLLIVIVGAPVLTFGLYSSQSDFAGPVLAVSLVLLLVLSLPIAIALGMSAFASLLVQGTAPPDVIVMRMYGGVDVTALTAVPFFMLAGEVMARGGMAQRLTDFAAAIVGWVRGGLGLADIVASLIFADTSGSCVADTAAIGSVMIPGLIRRGYEPRLATALQAAAGSLGMMFPPSITMIIYAWVADVSVARLFLASFVPGFMVALSYAIVTYVIARRRNLPREQLNLSPRRMLTVTKDGAFALIAPAIILGGIVSGVFSPTESGVVAVVYTLLVSILIYRTIDRNGMLEGLRATVVGTSRVMFIVAGAIGLSWLLTTMLIPQSVVGAVSGLAKNPIALLLLINLVLMFLHTFLESSATLLLVVPVLLPTLAASHIDPTYFGIILVMNSALGLLMPPIGLLLYVASSISRISLEEAAVAALPYVSVLAADLLILIFLPEIVNFVPHLVYGH